MDLEMMDRIRIRFSGDEAVTAAADVWADYIQKETLATALEPVTGQAGKDDEIWDLNGHPTRIFVEKE
jgi:hypothetical protein